MQELQEDVNKWLEESNSECPHTGKYCYGKTPLQTFVEAKHLAQEKMIGENNLPFQENMEIKPEATMALEVTTAKFEGVR